MRYCLTPLLLLSLHGSLFAQDDISDLLKRVPPYMNTIAVFHVNSLMKSPRALKEKWRDKHELRYMAGASNIPSSASLAMVIAHLNPSQLGNIHGISMIPIDYVVDMNSLAGREHGTLELLGDSTAILSQSRGYVINIDNKVLATSSSFDRQDLGRWVRFAKRNKDVVASSYLNEVISQHKNDQIVIALDAEDMVDQTSARIEVIASNILAGNAFATNNFSKFLCSLRGVRIVINIGEQTEAVFQLDFANSAEDWDKVLPKFLPKAIATFGADIDELANTPPTIKGKSVSIRTTLTDASLRRILSLVTTPGTSGGTPPDKSNKAEASSVADLAQTLRYFRTVNQVINDLGQFTIRDVTRKKENYVNSALWYDTFANKIDQLSIQGVDPDMVKFGTSISAKLRALASSLRGLKIQLNAYDSYAVETSVATGGLFWSPYGYGFSPGGVAMDSNISTVRTRQADLVAQAAPDRERVWSVIQQDRILIRQKMSEKYKIDINSFK